MNHDLLATGHPRLNFELTTYFANLPRHWDDKADQQRQPNREAVMWEVGQMVSARTSLALLLATRTV